MLLLTISSKNSAPKLLDAVGQTIILTQTNTAKVDEKKMKNNKQWLKICSNEWISIKWMNGEPYSKQSFTIYDDSIVV